MFHPPIYETHTKSFPFAFYDVVTSENGQNSVTHKLVARDEADALDIALERDEKAGFDRAKRNGSVAKVAKPVPKIPPAEIWMTDDEYRKKIARRIGVKLSATQTLESHVSHYREMRERFNGAVDTSEYEFRNLAECFSSGFDVAEEASEAIRESGAVSDVMRILREKGYVK